MAEKTSDGDGSVRWRPSGSPGVVLGAGAMLGLGAVGWVSVVALSIVLLDGVMAWLVLLASGIAGGWVFPLLGIGEARRAERWILGGALGVGIFSLVVLGLGAAGLLTKMTLGVVLGASSVAGVVRVYLDMRRARGEGMGKQDTFALVWLAVVPFFVLMLLACALPPGVLWLEEARGYDVLEYHLGVPKTFYEEGAIGFLPQNVYSNFPLNYEMLALAMMTLQGDAVEAAFMAQMANVFLAGLFVASAWLAGSTWSPRAGIVAGVLAGTAPWLTYLAGIAYVETGMLAMGMASWACLLRATRGGDRDGRWVLLAGLLSGLACGFKYTAVPFVALPGVVLLFAVKAKWKVVVRDVLLFGLGTLITFSPWLIRNTINTGNPVFPLAYDVFGGDEASWSEELAQRWKAGHAPPAPSWTQERVATRMLHRAGELWSLSLGDLRIGWMLLFIALMGAMLHRDRVTLTLLVAAGLQCGVWIVFTHHFARFASVMLLPLVLLGGQVFRIPRLRFAAPYLAAWIVLGAGLNLYRFTEAYGGDASLLPDRTLYGRTQVFLNGLEPTATLNTLGPKAKILLVGEARIYYVRPPVEYAVVFSRHPLEVILEDLPDRPTADEALTPEQAAAVLGELQDRGITHIFVNWSEVRRFRRTYGFPPEINERLFACLESAGLRTIKRFHAGESEEAWAVLYMLETAN